MKTYNTFDNVENLMPCMKKHMWVHAKQINEDFRVNTLEGNYKQGKAGDYLMKGVQGELYICDKSIFEQSYNFKVKVGISMVRDTVEWAVIALKHTYYNERDNYDSSVDDTDLLYTLLSNIVPLKMHISSTETRMIISITKKELGNK